MYDVIGTSGQLDEDDVIGTSGQLDEDDVTINYSDIEAELNNKMNSIFVQDLELECSTDDDSSFDKPEVTNQGESNFRFDELLSGLRKYSIKVTSGSESDFGLEVQSQLPLSNNDSLPLIMTHQDESLPIGSMSHNDLDVSSTLDFLEAEARISLIEIESDKISRRDKAAKIIQKYWRGAKERKLSGKIIRAQRDSRDHRKFVARAEKIEFEERIRIQKERDQETRDQEIKLIKNIQERDQLIKEKEFIIKKQINEKKFEKKIQKFQEKMILVNY